MKTILFKLIVISCLNCVYDNMNNITDTVIVNYYNYINSENVDQDMEDMFNF